MGSHSCKGASLPGPPQLGVTGAIDLSFRAAKEMKETPQGFIALQKYPADPDPEEPQSLWYSPVLVCPWKVNSYPNQDWEPEQHT